MTGFDTVRMFTVSELNRAVKQLLEEDLRFLSVCVQGELSNYKIYPSGHHYFTLKDSESSLRCVLFRNSARGLHFRPENGIRVSAIGRLQVYVKDGNYQLVCSELIPDGIGDLQLAFEQLKMKLYREGLFDRARKKQLPEYPERIVLITSAAGAAVHDMIRILGTRWPMARILVFPVHVQGNSAASEIAEAISCVNEWQNADCIITGRGGGSLEDLWAFNEECVARAIAASRIPVISAVGHEPDVTISDFVADLRASTPSNAAELVVPDQNEIRDNIRTLSERLLQVFSDQLLRRRQLLDHYSKASALKEASFFVDIRRMELDSLSDRLFVSFRETVSGKRMALAGQGAALQAMNPRRVLSRGYLIAENSSHTVLRSILQLTEGELISLKFADGTANCIVNSREVDELGR